MLRIPQNLKTLKDQSKQADIDLPTGGCAMSLRVKHLETEIDVKHKSLDNILYTYRYCIRLVNIGPVAFFSDFQLTSSSGEDVEKIGKAHVALSMYKSV